MSHQRRIRLAILQDCKRHILQVYGSVPLKRRAVTMMSQCERLLVKAIETHVWPTSTADAIAHTCRKAALATASDSKDEMAWAQVTLALYVAAWSMDESDLAAREMCRLAFPMTGKSWEGYANG